MDEDEFLDEIEERKEVWNIQVKSLQTWVVAFEEPLTKEEALDAFMMQDYYDVIDQKDIDVLDAIVED